MLKPLSPTSVAALPMRVKPRFGPKSSKNVEVAAVRSKRTASVAPRSFTPVSAVTMSAGELPMSGLSCTYAPSE